VHEVRALVRLEADHNCDRFAVKTVKVSSCCQREVKVCLLELRRRVAMRVSERYGRECPLIRDGNYTRLEELVAFIRI